MLHRPLAVLLLALAPSLPLYPRDVDAQHDPSEAEASAEPPRVEEGIDYRVYDRAGRAVSLHTIVDAAMGDDVLLVGEEHDDMIGHAFETLLLEAVLGDIGSPSNAGRTVVLSLEMFERDVQYVLDEYLDGLVSEDHFLRSARPWDDYEARYRPLVETARERGAPVLAANAPRRYVNRVTREGPESLEALSAQARSYLPPLPYPGPSAVYREQWEAIMTAAMAGAEEGDEEAQDSASADEGRADPSSEGAGAQEGGYEMSPNVIYAQALWDAAMGHAITEALVRHIGGFVVHFAGSFHVERATGIPERIADYRPGTRVTSVVMTKVDDIDAWSADEHRPLADFVVLTKRPPA